MRKRCKTCRKNITDRHRTKYCSEACGMATRRYTHCPVCGKKLAANGTRPGKVWSKYCSDTCHQFVADWSDALGLNRQRQAAPRPHCHTCDKKIYSHRRRYCSDACTPKFNEKGDRNYTSSYQDEYLEERFPGILAEAAQLKALLNSTSGSLGVNPPRAARG